MLTGPEMKLQAEISDIKILQPGRNRRYKMVLHFGVGLDPYLAYGQNLRNVYDSLRAQDAKEIQTAQSQNIAADQGARRA